MYEQLNESQKLLRVPFKPYVNKIITNLRNTLSNPDKQLQLIVTVDNCEMSSSLAVSLGIIINEAVMNAYKYAFENAKQGIIRIDFEQKGPHGILDITDSGIGFTGGAPPTGSGLSIMKEMAEHIQGKINFYGDGGFRVEVDFPLA